MNKHKTAEPLQRTAQCQEHIALLCSLQKTMAEHLKKLYREVGTSNSLGECKKDLLKG